MANAERFTKTHKYYCNSCDCYFPGEPMKGYWFNTSPHRRDDDGDTFVEGETKVMVGNPAYACHNDDGVCLLAEGDWTVINCEGFRCTNCGGEWMWDNDACSDHTYGSGADGRRAAEAQANACCGGQKKSSPSGSGNLDRLATPKEGAQKVTVLDF